MQQSGTKRRGRPPKPEQERKRGYLAFRARDHLRDDLRRRAEREGRSISEEIEHRLERSLYEEELFGDAVHVRLVVQNIGRIFHELELLTGRRAFGPHGDPWLHQQAWEALSRWFAATRPAGEIQAPSALSDAYEPRPPDTLISALGDLVMTAELGELLATWQARRSMTITEPGSEYLWRSGRARRAAQRKGGDQ